MLRRKDLIEGDVFYYQAPGNGPSDTYYVGSALPGSPRAWFGKSKAYNEADNNLSVTLVWRESTERRNARIGTTSDNPASVPNELGSPSLPATLVGSENSDTAAPGSVGGAGNVRGSIYAKLNPEPIDAIEGWGLNFRLANVIKYVARHGRKPGATASSDLRKALNYLKREIAAIEGVRSWECSE